MLVTENTDYAKLISHICLHGINKDVFDCFTFREHSWFYEFITLLISTLEVANHKNTHS